MALQDEIENFTTTVEDAVSYPILTRDASDYPASRNGSSSSNGSGNGVTSITRAAKQTIRDVLGWRYRVNDPKGFLAALNKSFSLKEVEGHVEWEWKAQSYMVQADMGEITGAQASVYKQASVSLENALPLLDGLTPLRTDADAEDTEAMRAIIRTEMTELVGELGLIGGPRVQRVDSFFEKLIGTLPPASFDPEHVSGQLARMRQRFGLSRARVNTITEEQNLTNFLILVDYVNSLYQSWDLKRGFFDRTAEPFLGTQLVLLSEILDAILEQLQETYDAMDSVFFGPAERQTTEIELSDGPMTVTEILSWVENFAAVEGRQLIQEGGKDGVVVFNSTMVRLRDIVQEAAGISAQPSTNPVRPFHTRRVALALGELTSYLSTAVDRASEIRRRTLQVAEHLGKEENEWWLKSALVRPTLLTRVDAVDWVELGRGKRALSARKAGDKIFQGDWAKTVLWGFFPRVPLSLDFGDDITVEKISYDASKRKVVALLRVKNDATTEWHDLVVEDCEQQRLTVRDALYVSAPVCESEPGKIEAEFEPHCGHQGESKVIRFTGQGLAGSGVCFGRGNNIRTRTTTYTNNGMNVEIAIQPRARIGYYNVSVFTADGGCRVLDQKFQVLAATTAPLFEVAVTPATHETDECQPETTGEYVPENGEQDMQMAGAAMRSSGAQKEAKRITAEDLPQHVCAALKAAGTTNVKHYKKHSWPASEKWQKGRKRKLEVELQPGQIVESAWVVSRKKPFEVIKGTNIRQQGTRATMWFDPTARPSHGVYDLVKILKGNFVEHVEKAVILK